jgi:AcrR family transcriptional regulator
VERADRDRERLRKTPRQARSRSTVEAILAAADRVLRSEGYGAASTNRVARVAGFSVGSLYQYFDDKQAVVGALLDQALRAEAQRVAEALDAAVALSPEAACDRSVRVLLSERRSKAHLLRILDAFAVELGAAPPLRHVARVQGAVLADPLHRFAAAHFGGAFRAGLDEGLAVAARFVNAAGYALAVDAPERLTDEAIAKRVAATLAVQAHGAPAVSSATSALLAAWELRPVPAFADAAGRARRVRETRSALVRGSELAPAALEPTVFVAAALGEAIAELREAPVPGLDPALVHEHAAQLVQACLDAAPR